jgi:hypothetical protein
MWARNCGSIICPSARKDKVVRLFGEGHIRAHQLASWRCQAECATASPAYCLVVDEAAMLFAFLQGVQVVRLARNIHLRRLAK